MQQNVVLRLCWMWQQVHYCIYLAWAAKWSTSPVFAYMIKQVNEATWWNETFLLEWYRRLRPCYEAELFCVKGSFTDYKELDFLKKSRMNGRGYGWSHTVWALLLLNTKHKNRVETESRWYFIPLTLIVTTNEGDFWFFSWPCGWRGTTMLITDPYFVAWCSAEYIVSVSTT